MIRFVLLVLLFNFVMYCIVSTIVVAFEINIYLSIYLSVYIDAPNTHWKCTTVYCTRLILCSQSPNAAVESSATSLTTSNVALERNVCGERCYSQSGPAAWNSLPNSIKLAYN